MNRTNLRKFSLLSILVLASISFSIIPSSSALATSDKLSDKASTSNRSTDASTTSDTTAATTSSKDQTRLAAIIKRGDSEITRRLTSLNTVSSKITAATKLSSTDKASLGDEVKTEISSLTALKTKLDAETTVAAAQTDAQSIFSDYRVYALLIPKVQLIRAADDQQVAEAKLAALTTKLQTRLTTSNASLTDLQAKVTAAQAISSKIESGVIGLQPSDYNSNHSLLSGDRDQLKTAQADIVAARADAQAIITSLKN